MNAYLFPSECLTTQARKGWLCGGKRDREHKFLSHEVTSGVQTPQAFSFPVGLSQINLSALLLLNRLLLLLESNGRKSSLR